MKVGDLVRWKSVENPGIGIVLKTKPTKPPKGKKPMTAVFAFVPECPEPEWFLQCELQVIK